MPARMDNDRPTVRIGTWNVEWAGADSERGVRVAAALRAPDCDIVRATEGRAAARLRCAPPATQLGRETRNALTFELDRSTGVGHT